MKKNTFKHIAGISCLMIFISIHFKGLAQKDSLLKGWNNSSMPDTARFDAFDEMIWNYYLFSDPDSAVILTEQLLTFSKKENLDKQTGRTYSLMGTCYYLKGDFIQAIDQYNQSVAILESLGENTTGPLNNLGACYLYIGDLHSAIKAFEKVMKICERQQDWEGYAGAHSNLGAIYLKQENTEKALGYFRTSLSIRDTIGDQRGMSESLTNIGVIHDRLHNYDSALYYYNRSLEIDSIMQNKHGMISIYSNLSSVSLHMGDTRTAEYYIDKSLSLSIEIGDKKGEASGYNVLASIYLEQNKISQAKNVAQRAFELAKEIKYLEGVKTSSHTLYEVYKRGRDYKNALEMFEEYVILRDSLINEEHSRDLIQQEYQYEYEKKAVADSLIQFEQMKLNNLKVEAAEAKAEKNELELSAQRKQIVYLIIGLFLLVFFAFFMFNRFKVTQRQKKLIAAQQKETEAQKEQIVLQHEKLEASHKEINDSIVYAKRLQEAILPKRSEIDENLKNNFILFNPKDIVSGDFYWFEQLNETSYIAVADCTGHGVPGAMVSVVCSNALNRSLLEFNKLQPNEILDKSREIIIETFAKSGHHVRDGMDISLCAINGTTLSYAGAHNPLWIVRNGALIELKADKQPVGTFEKMTPFAMKTLNLEKGDLLYLFSDGFVDQFGGEKGKKFKTSGFRNLLLSLCEQEMDQQEARLKDVFQKWRGGIDQLDDVCVIGVRV